MPGPSAGHLLGVGSPGGSTKQAGLTPALEVFCMCLLACPPVLGTGVGIFSPVPTGIHLSSLLHSGPCLALASTPSPGALQFGLTLLGSICPGCKVVIKEDLEEIWKENEGGFMILGEEFCCWLGAV